LRLERVDNTVNALCSADGNEWFTVDHVEFPVDDPVEVGLFAIGTLYQPHLYSGVFCTSPKKDYFRNCPSFAMAKFGFI